MPEDPPDKVVTPPVVTPEGDGSLYEYPDPLVLPPGYTWIVYTVGPDKRDLSEEERRARKLPVAVKGTKDIVIYTHLPKGGRKRSTRRSLKTRNGVSRRARRRV